MYIDFSSLFHQSSKDLTDKGTVRIPADSSKWPVEWNTIYYKSYPRVPHIPLIREKGSADLFDILEHRRSKRSFSGKPIDMKVLSQILLYSAGILNPKKTPFRAHPSGGGRFPLEIYPIFFTGTDIKPGVYHYNVRDHALDVLWERNFTHEEIKDHFVYQWVENVSCVLVVTAVFRRTQMKYGERGYRYVLLEAGHMSENVYLVAESLGVSCCAMAGTKDGPVEKLLDIDGVTESVIHSLVLG